MKEQKPILKLVIYSMQEIDSRHGKKSYNYTQSAIYKFLDNTYTLEFDEENAEFHLYFNYYDYMPLDSQYRDAVNIYITDTSGIDDITNVYLHIPDMNLFDYVIGPYFVSYDDRAFLWENQDYKNVKKQADLEKFLLGIFASKVPYKRKKEVIQLYYDTKDNVWQNYEFLQAYNISSKSSFFSLLRFLMTVRRVLTKKDKKNIEYKKLK